MKTSYPIQAWVAFIALSLVGCKRSEPRSIAASLPSVTVAQPLSRKVNEWDEYTGRLASPETVELRARVSGYIEKVHFKEGSEVKLGELLFTIDRRPYKAVVDRAKAELSGARARAELAAGEAKRAESLASTKAISTDAFETRVKTAVQASEAVHSAEAALTASELDLEFTEVRAPIAGRISNARITAGNLVTGGNTASSTLLTTIVSLDPLYCYFDVDEASALRYRQLYREGKRASAIFETVAAEMALGNEIGFPRKGVIDFVDNQLNAGNGTIRARGVFPNTDRLMAPGFFARLRIPGNGEYDAVLVRDLAINNDQGRAFVMTVDAKDTVSYRPLRLGPLLEGLRVVREGLTASDRVIVGGMMNARPGIRVQVTTTNMAIAQVSANGSANGGFAAGSPR